MIPAWIVAASRNCLDAAQDGWDWMGRVFWGPRFWKIASEFFLEAAVLIAVFPVLDTLITSHKVTVHWVIESEGLAIGLLALAAILGSVEHGEE